MVGTIALICAVVALAVAVWVLVQVRSNAIAQTERAALAAQASIALDNQRERLRDLGRQFERQLSRIETQLATLQSEVSNQELDASARASEIQSCQRALASLRTDHARSVASISETQNVVRAGESLTAELKESVTALSSRQAELVADQSTASLKETVLGLAPVVNQLARRDANHSQRLIELELESTRNGASTASTLEAMQREVDALQRNQSAQVSRLEKSVVASVEAESRASKAELLAATAVASGADARSESSAANQTAIDAHTKATEAIQRAADARGKAAEASQEATVAQSKATEAAEAAAGVDQRLRTDVDALTTKLSDSADMLSGSAFHRMPRVMTADDRRSSAAVAETLNVELKTTEIGYLYSKVSAVERRCRGRMATLAATAVARAITCLATEGDDLRILEIGTLHGVSAAYLHEVIAARYPNFHQTLIDPFEGYYGVRGIDLSTPVPVTEELVRHNMNCVGATLSDYTIVKGKSEDDAVLEHFAEANFELIVIDGDHSYEGVERDFFNYADKVLAGGLLIVDDYDGPSWPEVTRFVDEVAKSDARFDFVFGRDRTAVFRKLP